MGVASVVVTFKIANNKIVKCITNIVKELVF